MKPMFLSSRFIQIFLPSVVLLTGLPAQAQTFAPPTSPQLALSQGEEKTLETRAINLLELARKGQYEAVRKQLGTTLAQQITTADIKQRWEQVTSITGPVKKVVSSRVLSTVDSDLVIITTEFANYTDDIIVTFNKKGEIVGVNFPKRASVESVAEKIVEAIDNGDFAEVRRYLHPFLKTEVYPQRLTAGWDKLERENGQFKRVISTDIKPSLDGNGASIVIVTAEFANATKDIFFIFDNQTQITGIDLSQ